MVLDVVGFDAVVLEAVVLDAVVLDNGRSAHRSNNASLEALEQFSSSGIKMTANVLYVPTTPVRMIFAMFRSHRHTAVHVAQ